MGDNPLRPFAYAHSASVLRALTIEVQSRRHYIPGGYDFLENSGEHTAFDEMIKRAKEMDRINPLYVETVKEFAGTMWSWVLKNRSRKNRFKRKETSHV